MSLRLLNTIRYLKPIQLFYRVRNRFVIKKQKHYGHVNYKKVNIYIEGLHSDASHIKRFSFNGDIIELLNTPVELDYKNLSNLSPLLQFNAQYFEYAIVWSQKGIGFSFLKQKWNEYLAAGLPLQPYVISLQLVNMIVAMNIYGVDDQDIYDELCSRYRWLLRHQEKHLLANHYIENLKAIVIASFVFNDDKIYHKYLRKLKKECQEQILNDGVHFELSMMYHKLILEDLLLVSRICKEGWIKDYIQKMLNAVCSLENGFNRTPLFNDAGDNVSKSVSSLAKACKDELALEPVLSYSFANSGYYKLEQKNVSLLVDCGNIGPKYNPGHGHCDCLSFELFVDKKPLIVNCGTYEYQGPDRAFFRSTKAHNTVMIGNHEQSECWGEHRVAKRIAKVNGELDGNCFRGSYRNAFGESHQRSIELNDSFLEVLDATQKAKDGASVESYLHLAPGFSFENNKIVGNGIKIPVETIGCDTDVSTSLYAKEFGLLENVCCVTFRWKSDNEFHGYIIDFSKKEICVNG